MKEVDARGLSCPEPLMMTAEALNHIRKQMWKSSPKIKGKRQQQRRKALNSK